MLLLFNIDSDGLTMTDTIITGTLYSDGFVLKLNQ